MPNLFICYASRSAAECPSSAPVAVQFGVVVGAGEGDDVDRCADPGGFQDVAGAVDGAEVDGDVAGEADDVPGLPLLPGDWGAGPYVGQAERVESGGQAGGDRGGRGCDGAAGHGRCDVGVVGDGDVRAGGRHRSAAAVGVGFAAAGGAEVLEEQVEEVAVAVGGAGVPGAGVGGQRRGVGLIRRVVVQRGGGLVGDGDWCSPATTFGDVPQNGDGLAGPASTTTG